MTSLQPDREHRVLHVKWNLLAFMIAAGVALVAGAQHPGDGYPSKPIRMVVPFTPGGSNDIVARIIGLKMAEGWGQQVVIDNRPGAGEIGRAHV